MGTLRKTGKRKLGKVRWAKKRHPESEKDIGKVDTKRGTQTGTERNEEGQGKRGRKANKLNFFKRLSD